MNVPQTAIQQRHPDWWVTLLLWGMGVFFVASIAVVLAPVVLMAVIAFVVAEYTAVKWWWIALAAVVVALVFHLFDLSPFEAVERVMERATNISEKRGFDVAVRRIWNHKVAWWMRTLPATPIGIFLGALTGTLVDSRYPMFDQRAELRKQRAIEVGRVRAQRKVSKAPDAVRGLAVMGPFVRGDLPQPWVRRFRTARWLCIHPVLLGRHLVIVGKPGSGKTTTLLRLAYLAAKVYGWRVYFLDGKGDLATMHEFTALMLAAGLSPGEIAAFPVMPFDGWRTTDEQQGYAQLLSRLMGGATFTEPYYRDITRRYLSHALRAGASLPRSSRDLLSRLERLAAEAPAELRREASSTLARFEGLFDSFPGDLDGGWSFSDCRSGYVLLKGLANRDEAQNLAGYLFECFKQFATDMKDPSDRVLLIVDEFPAVMGDADAAGMIERLRSFGVGVALSGQSFIGLGPDRDRIVEAAGTLLLHRLSASDELARMAGTVQEYAVTTQVDFEAGATGRGTVTPEHRFKAEPNTIGRQRDGEITLITDRCVGHGFVTRVSPSEDLRIAASEAIESFRPSVPPAADRSNINGSPSKAIELS